MRVDTDRAPFISMIPKGMGAVTKRLITNVRVVNEGRIFDADVLIVDGRIERVENELFPDGRTEILDASGKYLIPGMIDDQVHFREPGLIHKGDIATESAAAVAGGVTSYLDMPNVLPPTTTRVLLGDKYALAASHSRANYSFYLGASNDNIEQIRNLSVNEACGIKVFMGASTGNLLVTDPQILELIFAEAPILVATHCEDTPTISTNERIFRKKYGESIPIACHPQIRSSEACFKSSTMAVELAKRNGTRLHILHLTTAKEMELLNPLPTVEKRITAEVCVHHLFFDQNDYRDKGTLIKCNPAIKTTHDRNALVDAVNDGRIDVIATDHAPHTLKEKEQTYFNAAAGLPLVQHPLLILLELYRWKRLSLETIVQKVSHAPAQIFGIKERGYIREGYWADLVLLDLEDHYQVEPENILYKCGWSPFIGYRFHSSVWATFVNGELAYFHKRVSDHIRGRRLEHEYE